jgi:hypothetical protein
MDELVRARVRADHGERRSRRENTRRTRADLEHRRRYAKERSNAERASR